MIGNFRQAAAFTLSKAVEGGFVNNPHDKGGPTNMGITLETLSEWRGQSCTVADVQALTRDEALKIYQARYWAPNKSDELPAPVAVALFDGAVNSGPGQSAKWLQKAVGAAEDGSIGPATIAAIGKMSNADIIRRMIYNRRLFDRALHDYAVFGHGWETRLDSLQEYCLKILGGLV
jgi:lysozyme family protein